MLLCLFWVALPLYSKGLQSLSLGTGNDWYTMGLGYNHDDGRSYGVHLHAEFESGFLLQVDAEGYTDRISSQKRYDLITILASFPYHFANEQSYFSLTGSLGLMLSGNLGFAWVQNSYHNFINRDPVTISYYSNEAKIHPAASLHTETGVVLGVHRFGLYFDYGVAGGWEQHIVGGLVFTTPALSLQAGYHMRWITFCYPCQETQANRYSGLILGYTHNGGLLSSFYTTYLDSGFSYGGFLIDILSLQRPKNFSDADITVSTGFLYDLIGQQNRLFAISFDHISFEIKHKNGPMFNQMGNQTDRLNIGSWMLGYSHDMGRFNFGIPYLKVQGGLGRYNLQKDFTQTIVETLLPTFALEVGLRHLFNASLFVDRQHYTIRFVSVLHYLPFRPTIASGYEDFSKHSNHLTVQLGIVFDIAHDLSE